jgi:hypothetical protein
VLKKLDKFDNQHLSAAANRVNETSEDEKRAIGLCMGMYAANEPVDRDEFDMAMRAVYRLGITTPPLGFDLNK